MEFILAGLVQLLLLTLKFGNWVTWDWWIIWFPSILMGGLTLVAIVTGVIAGVLEVHRRKQAQKELQREIKKLLKYYKL